MNAENILPPCYLVTKPRNREEKRKVYFELKRNLPRLTFINDEFVYKILEENELTYKEVYYYYLELWNATIEWMNKSRMFIHTKPNEYYFTQCYYPVEYVR